MRWACKALLFVSAVGLAHSCMLLPGLPPATGRTSSSAGGLIREFILPPGNPTSLDLGSSNHLLFAVSASDSSVPSFQFRIQHARPDPLDSWRQAGDAALLKEPGVLSRVPARHVQAGGSSTETFWINIGDSSLQGDRQRSAILKQTTAHAYFYVDNDPQATIGDDQIQRLADTFEQRIYPLVTSTFGADPATDLAGDAHVYVVLSPAVDDFAQDSGLMGYFWSRDVLPATTTGASPRLHSNQKKVIFLTSRIFAQQPYTTFGTLAHEFTHLCVFNQKVLAPSHTVPEDTWLDEGWAMLSMDLCGYGLRGGNDEIAKDIQSFQQQPMAYSLTDWFHNPNGFSYGLSYLFTRYLYDRFGPNVIRDIMSDPNTGVDAVQGALAKRGLSFQDVFTDWSVANAISGLGLTNDPRFTYSPDINLHGTYGTTTLAGVTLKPVAQFPKSLPSTLRPWGTAYYDLRAAAPKAWSFQFDNPFGLFGGAVSAP